MKAAWKQQIVWTAAVFGIVISLQFAAPAGSPATEVPKMPAHTMAMLDVAYVFKNHKAFNSEMKVLELKAQALHQRGQATQAQLQLLKARMEQTADKSEKEKLEIELAAQGTDFQIWMRKAQEEHAALEARIYHETYQLLVEETKKHCRAKGIQVVLKFVRDPIKENDRRSIMEGLNRAIIFSDAPDISDDILKALDAAAEVKAAQAKTGELKR